MKEYRISNFSVIASFVALFLVIMFGINTSARLALIEQRYDLLLNNTLKLAGNLSNVLSSLESDKVMRQLSSKIDVLKESNKALEQKDQKKKIGKEQVNTPAKVNNLCGNRGFLIKDGKLNK